MFLLIVLGVLAIAGIVGTLVLVPRGQDNRYADRQWHSTTHETYHSF
ncbi:MAG: hypothetical protein QOK08_1488 [Actinomycetota bacterium]|jgi:hypothetical protein|nr:hypothetical protein [Glaciihabitans sp.]MDQ1543850.1 hypothetical protein [Actinomycetota bacterium]MDQ1563890.1 hypothetical protein [Actinomycetota bacterium]MDQ1573427.1 hypothetical protein [Actinomycetota bacterium]